MMFSELFSLIKNVIISPEVIIITVVLVLYLNLVFYVIHYHKPALPSFQSRSRKSSQSALSTVKTEADTPAASAS